MRRGFCLCHGGASMPSMGLTAAGRLQKGGSGVPVAPLSPEAIRDSSPTLETQTRAALFTYYNTFQSEKYFCFRVIRWVFLPLMCNFRFYAGTTLQLWVAGAALTISLVHFSRKLRGLFQRGHVSGNIA